MGLVQTETNTQHRGARTYHSGSKAASAEAPAPADADAQDEQLWECAIANSMDTIRSMADKALADRKAGRTKKVAF